jgi:2TM family of unknown function (DUF5676)
MLAKSHADQRPRRTGSSFAVHRAPTIPVVALGLASSLFLAISFLLCVLGYLLLPSLPVPHAALSLVLPGFVLLTWRSFLLGLVESIGWGWYVTLIFGPLYNYFVSRFSHASA